MAQDYTTIRVTQSAKDAAEASKRDGETWNDYLQRCTDTPPTTREFVEASDVEVDEREIANAVTSDLLASLPSKVADEMEGRMR